jgi:branched-chain amino acid aminotransferase
MFGAKDQGFSQVLWLDGIHRKYVEEVGTMNIFFVKNKTIITPKLTGSILHGITRDSILKLGTHLGYKVLEERLDIDEVCSDIDNGIITEAFGAGTAATISPVGELNYKGKAHTIGNFKNGKITCELYEKLFGIQYGCGEDPFNWNRIIKK